MSVVVLGHRNPDTDAVVSAIAFTELLKSMGMDAVAGRAGPLQPETRLVLEKVGLAIPTLVDDVRPRVKDAMVRDVAYVRVGEPVKKAIDMIVEKNIRALPVIGRGGRVVGVFSVESFARRFVHELRAVRLKLDGVPIKNFLDLCGGEVIVGSGRFEFRGYVYVAAMGIEEVGLRGEELRGNIVVVGSREDVVEKVIELGVNAVILTGGYTPSPRIVELARERRVLLIKSPYDTYTTLRLLDLSRPVEKFAEPPITIHEDASISELRELMVRSGMRTVIVVDDLGKLRGVVTRSDLVKDYRKKVALVDHNEFSQSVEGVEEANIVAVVDHHRVSGDIKTYRPIIFRVEPLGSTSSLIWKMSREMGVELDKKIVEAMIYALLSDTLLLRSSTTTPYDVQAFEEMCSYVGLDRDRAIDFMRLAMAANEPSDPREIVTRDLKIFEFAGKRFGIAQVFTTKPDNYVAMLPRLREEMRRLLREHRLDFVVLMVTDYVERKSLITAVGSCEPVEKAFGDEVSTSFVELPGATSRKNDVLPRILKALEEG